MAFNTIAEIVSKKSALKRFVDAGGDEDLSILADPPCVVEIAGRKIRVRALTLDNHKRWLVIFGTILRQYELVLEAAEWPDAKIDVAKQREKWQAFFSVEKVQREILTLVEQTLFREPGNLWWRLHKRWFRKHVTVMELMDLFFYLYLWNCEAVKKNAIFLLARMGFARRKATLYGGWSQNLAGHSGAQVQPRYPVSPPTAATPSAGAQCKTRPSVSSSSSVAVLPRRPTSRRSPANAPPLPRSVGGGR